MSKNRNYPDFNNENEEREDNSTERDLQFNTESNSFELDVKNEDPDYLHTDPYETSAKNGEDMNSTYDEANPYDTAEEYIPNESLETDVEKLGMHIENDHLFELSLADRELGHTPEDDRDDLDEEGYPKNDRKR